MNWGWVTLNLAYVIYAVSGIYKDMLRLRVVLLVATGLFIAYGIVADIWSVFWWNIPVAAVHLWQTWQLIQQRRGIDLDAEAEAIRTLLYPDLSRTDYNSLWHASHECMFSEGDVLIVASEPVEAVYLILDGEVDVEVSDDLTVRLGRLRLVGEMSSVTGGDATATVTAVGAVRARAWTKAALASLLLDNAEVERAYLRAIGTELTRKLT